MEDGVGRVDLVLRWKRLGKAAGFFGVVEVGDLMVEKVGDNDGSGRLWCGGLMR